MIMCIYIHTLNIYIYYVCVFTRQAVALPAAMGGLHWEQPGWHLLTAWARDQGQRVAFLLTLAIHLAAQTRWGPKGPWLVVHL